MSNAAQRTLASSAPLAACFFSLPLAAANWTPPDGQRGGGPVIALASPPAPLSAWRSACSFRHALCVHSSARSSPSHSFAALAAADRAWDVLTGALELPPPDTDIDGAWHVYLVDPSTGAAHAAAKGVALLQERDPRTRYDSAASFGMVDGRTPPGCELDLAMAHALASGIIRRAAPATDEGTVRAESEMLARIAVSCAAPDEDTAQFQANPERTIIDPTSDNFDRGAWLFFDWCDRTYAREPAGLILGLWALAPTSTPPGAWRWADAPTGFDVLRTTLKRASTEISALDDVLVRFAINRAQGTPPVRVSWRVPWPAQARRLASPEPVSPTGASYVVVDHSGAAPGAKLRIEVQWEDYGRMRWVVVKLDRTGRTVAELPITSLDRATHASLTVEDLDEVNRLLIVGVNVGSTEHPFDPNRGEWEPHAWLLTLEGQ